MAITLKIKGNKQVEALSIKNPIRDQNRSKIYRIVSTILPLFRLENMREWALAISSQFKD